MKLGPPVIGSALSSEVAVAVVGAGTMGAGIAGLAAEAGQLVYLYDTVPNAVRPTAPEVAATCLATAAAWGKTPVHCASTPGFIVNRVARPFYGEALRLLSEGRADIVTIDHIVEAAGRFRMGPFTLMDLVGLAVNLAVSKSVYDRTFHDPRFQSQPDPAGARRRRPSRA